MQNSEENTATFRRATVIYPQPIAVVAGYLLRTGSPQEHLDACLRAAEVVTRYLAALAAASFAARDGAGTDNLSLESLSDKNLAFGDYLRVVQRIVALGEKMNHPLKAHLSSFKAEEPLVKLLGLRNELGHQLTAISEAVARTKLDTHEPERLLAEALEALHGTLSLPLLLMEEQWLEKKRLLGRRLWLMGESQNPEPEIVALEWPGLQERRQPYVIVGEQALLLWPFLSWDILPSRQRYGLLFLDKVGKQIASYKSLDPLELDRNGEAIQAVTNVTSGAARPTEGLTLQGGGRMDAAWGDLRRRLEEAAAQAQGAIPWEAFDQTALEWFAARMKPGKTGKARSVVHDLLLDKRTFLTPSERRQAVLLLGKEAEVRKVLGRDMIDLRTVDPAREEERWQERVTSTKNVLASLRLAVEFFSRHKGVGSGGLESLDQTTGTADYLAMREALVNLFIHQDYGNATAAAQVELRPEQAEFFNTGASLVNAEALVQGGRSQSRNPLIARALRLVGFAELAGSGLRAVQQAWRKARRRPPRFDSNEAGNTFTARLDWREISDNYNAHWKAKLGVKLTEPQALVLNLSMDPAGLTIEQSASALGVTLDDAREIVRHLSFQQLVEEREGRYHIKNHLRGLVP